MELSSTLPFITLKVRVKYNLIHVWHKILKLPYAITYPSSTNLYRKKKKKKSRNKLGNMD